jgi:hypothetical protein
MSTIVLLGAAKWNRHQAICCVFAAISWVAMQRDRSCAARTEHGVQHAGREHAGRVPGGASTAFRRGLNWFSVPAVTGRLQMNAAAGLTQALAERISATRWDDLPAAAQTVAKQCLLDFIGVALAGAREPLAEILNADAAELGGHPQAGLIGRGRRGNVEQAALINGAAGHAHDYDDVHMAMNGHPTVPVAPAVFALAEHHHKGAKDLLAAFAAGVDTECIIGRYLGASHYAEGWHATGTLGSFGAAAAAANLLGLDAETTARALGIAGTQAAGLKSQFGTMCKPRGPRCDRGCASRSPRGARLHEPHRHPRNHTGFAATKAMARRRAIQSRADRKQLPARRLLQISRRLLHDALVHRSDPQLVTRTTSP